MTLSQPFRAAHRIQTFPAWDDIHMTTPLPGGYGPDSRLKEGPEPKYTQLAAVLAARIARGDYPGDTRLPSVAQLQDEFGVSRGAAQRAVSVLAAHGLVRAANGKGAWPVHSG